MSAGDQTMEFKKLKKTKLLERIVTSVLILLIVFTSSFLVLPQKARACEGSDCDDYRSQFNSVISVNSSFSNGKADATAKIAFTAKATSSYNFVDGGGSGTGKFWVAFTKPNDMQNAIFKDITSNFSDKPESKTFDASAGAVLDPGTNYEAHMFYVTDHGGNGAGQSFNGSSKNDYVQIGNGATFKTADEVNTTVTDSTQNGNGLPAGTNLDPASGLPECGIFNDSSVTGCVAQLAYYFLYVPTSLILSISGHFFDYMLGYNLKSDSYSISSAGQPSFVEQGWKVVRDISNIFFIFILLYLAISTILGTGGSDVKKSVGMVILIAILINFSLFFTRVIIDTSNVLAKIFYSTTEVTNKSSTNPVELKDDQGNKQLSLAIVSKFNPQKLLENVQPGTKVSERDENGTLVSTEISPSDRAGYFFLITVIMAAVNLIAAWMFFLVGFLFLGRVAGLWLLMIFAPVAFISYALPSKVKIPKFGHQEWWSNLLSQAFMAPVFIFFLYLLIQFLKIGVVLSGQSTVERILSVLIPIFFVVVILKAAKDTAVSMSGDIGKAMVSAAKSVGGLAIGAATGGAAMLGTATLGRIGARGAQDAELNAKAAAGDKVAQAKLATYNKLAGSSFDARATKFGGAIAKETGANIGKAKEGGFNKRAEEYKKKKDEKAKQYAENGSIAEKNANEEAKQDLFNKEHDTAKRDARGQIDPAGKTYAQWHNEAKDQLEATKTAWKNAGGGGNPGGPNQQNAQLWQNMQNAQAAVGGTGMGQAEKKVKDTHKDIKIAQNKVRNAYAKDQDDSKGWNYLASYGVADEQTRTETKNTILASRKDEK